MKNTEYNKSKIKGVMRISTSKVQAFMKRLAIRGTLALWHEGMSFEEIDQHLEDIRTLFIYKDIRYWPLADSFILQDFRDRELYPTQNIYCISQDFFLEHVLPKLTAKA